MKSMSEKRPSARVEHFPTSTAADRIAPISSFCTLHRRRKDKSAGYSPQPPDQSGQRGKCPIRCRPD